MNISTLFLNAAKRHPKHIAIVYKKQSITYEKLAEEVKQTAAYFQQKGIKKGDRVLVFVPMSIDLYRTVLALFYVGATAVFLDEWVSKKRMELCCQIANCKGFIGVPKARFLVFLSRQLRAIPIKLRLRKKGREEARLQAVENSDSALITFTTGSTGTPKAADRTHGFLNEQFNALLEEIDPSVTDVDLPLLPIVLFMNLGVGCTSVIARVKPKKLEKLNLSTITELMQNHNVNRITASPAFILKLAEKGYQKIDNQIEKIFTGGAPVFPNQAFKITAAFPTTAVKIVYGSTEANRLVLFMQQSWWIENKNLKKACLWVNLTINQQSKLFKLTKCRCHV